MQRNSRGVLCRRFPAKGFAFFPQGRSHIFKIHAAKMSIEKGIRFELLARLCPNSTGEWRGERGEGEGEGVSACVCVCVCVCVPPKREERGCISECH